MPAIALMTSTALRFTQNPIKFLSQPLKPHVAGFCLPFPSFLLYTIYFYLLSPYLTTRTAPTTLVVARLLDVLSISRQILPVLGLCLGFFPHLTQILMLKSPCQRGCNVYSFYEAACPILPLWVRPCPFCFIDLFIS